MKTTKWALLSAFCLGGFALQAQLDQFCGHTSKMQSYAVPAKPQSGNEQTQPTRSQYVIPVVFHVLHINGPENVSDTQIKNTLKAINEDFNKLNADRSQVIPEYADKIANIGVKLELARFDPQGNATTGINRIYTTLTNHGIDDSAKINQWPQHKYLNVWIVKDLGGSAAAVSFYPYYAQYYPHLDGIVCQYNYLGYSGAAGPISRHAMTHEVGHFLNLLHPFDNVIGAGPCGDDDVADTPITQSSGCDLTLSGCNSPVIENVQNFMTGSYCFIMFTEGQKTRMTNCLNNNEGGRRNLWQPANLSETLGEDYLLVIAEQSVSSLSVYPNPASHQLTLSHEGGEDITAFLVDLRGVTVWSGSVAAGQETTIDLTGISGGMYVVQSSAAGVRNQRLVTITR